MSHDDRFLIVQVVVLHMCFQFCSVWIASTVLASELHKEYRFFKSIKKQTYFWLLQLNLLPRPPDLMLSKFTMDVMFLHC